VSFRQGCTTAISRGHGGGLFRFGAQDTADGSAAEAETAGDLGFADASTVELPDLAGLFSDGHGPAEMLSLQPGFGDARADAFAKDLVFELGVLRRNAKLR
jgi:hypothetical protein